MDHVLLLVLLHEEQVEHLQEQYKEQLVINQTYKYENVVQSSYLLFADHAVIDRLIRLVSMEPNNDDSDNSVNT